MRDNQKFILIYFYKYVVDIFSIFAAKIYYNKLFGSMNVLETIRLRRMVLGLKQEDLAEMAGVSLSTIKDMDRGEGNPSLATLEKVVEVLGLELRLVVKG